MTTENVMKLVKIERLSFSFDLLFFFYKSIDLDCLKRM